MMIHRQWGAAVKNVSGTALIGELLLARRGVRPAHAEVDDAHQAEHQRARGREQRAWHQVSGRQPRAGRQAIHFGLVDEEKERIEPSQHPVVGAVEIRAPLALRVELADPGLRLLSELGNRPEHDRVGGTGLGAGGLQPGLQAVVTERALLGRVRDRIHPDDAEGAGRDAVTAPVARVGLDHDRVELGTDDGAGRAHLEAAGLDAMLAYVGHQEPAATTSIGRELLHEPDVAPVKAVEPARVVVAVPGERGRAPGAGRKLVPFLARDLAGLAADTHGRVREEAHRLGHQAFSTLQTKALPSWIVTFGSPTSDVSSFTTSPVTSPS